MGGRVAVLLCLLLAGPALADPLLPKTFEPPPRAKESRSPFEVNLAVDLPITLGAGAAALVMDLVGDELPGPWCGTACDPSGINALDRQVVGNTSRLAAQFSDGLHWSQIALPHLLGLVDLLVSDPTDGWSGLGKDTLVLLETLAVNSFSTRLVKSIVRRPRPYAYDLALPEQERTVPDAASSFYSGHTSGSFAMATAYSYTFTRRHPDSPLVVPVWLGTHLLAAATGVCRVQAGKHFWTDVLIGAAMGSAIGLIVPVLHERREDSSPPAALGSVSLAPVVWPEGLGLALLVR
jgi:membrane-associated phospholipid phosphatase